MKRILVINVNWVGDVIFSTPVFRALKSAYPDAKITCLGVPRVKDVLMMCPDVDHVIVYDEKGRHWTPWGKLGLVLQLKREKFDAAFILHRSFTRAFLPYLAGIPVRVGYDTKGRGGLLTQTFAPPMEAVHKSDYYQGVVEGAGIKVSDNRCTLSPDEQSITETESLLSQRGISAKDDFIIVNTGGNWDLKRWPAENFSRLITELTDEFPFKIVVSGAAKDAGRVDDIIRSSGREVVNLAGSTSLKHLAALMKRARLVISSDSGPMHVASAVGTDVIGIFGPTRSELTGPRGTGRISLLQHDVGCNRDSCYFLDCPDNVCMKSVSVEEVIRSARILLTDVLTRKANE